MKTLLAWLVFLGLAGWLGLEIYQLLQEDPGTGGSRRGDREARPAPVEVAAVERGVIDEMRGFTGTLDANAEFVVAAKVGGRIDRLMLAVSDL